MSDKGMIRFVRSKPRTEILSVYRVYLVITVHKILVADMRYKGAKKIAWSLDVQFKFAPLRTCVTAARLAVVLYSPVNSKE
jgi:hypothetical protein